VGNRQVLGEYVDDECDPTYVWCQGKVAELVMQTDTEAVVKIEWNETCVQHGDLKVTKCAEKVKMESDGEGRVEDKWCMETRFTSFDKVN